MLTKDAIDQIHHTFVKVNDVAHIVRSAAMSGESAMFVHGDAGGALDEADRMCSHSWYELEATYRSLMWVDINDVPQVWNEIGLAYSQCLHWEAVRLYLQSRLN